MFYLSRSRSPSCTAFNCLYDYLSRPALRLTASRKAQKSIQSSKGDQQGPESVAEIFIPARVAHPSNPVARQSVEGSLP